MKTPRSHVWVKTIQGTRVRLDWQEYECVGLNVEPRYSVWRAACAECGMSMEFTARLDPSGYTRTNFNRRCSECKKPLKRVPSTRPAHVFPG